MIKELREKYNAAFTAEKYEAFKQSLDARCEHKIDFRVAETPIFIPLDFNKKLESACEEIFKVILDPNFKSLTEASIPDNFKVANENNHSHFICIDFGICENQKGEIEPQLIELQGFASMFCWMSELGEFYKKYFELSPSLTHYRSGLNREQYFELLKRTIIGNENPKHVILLELKPEEQKTRVDFLLTKEYLGVESVCLSDLVQEGRKLYYNLNGERTEVKRIYNRLIFDDLEANPDFKYTADIFGDLDVEWVAHPNWFYRISKYTMPFLKHHFVPETRFLDQIKDIPHDLENYVLKPLFSFSGSGVVIDVSPQDIENIKDPWNWILQKKVHYAEKIQSPEGGVKGEIRMMYFWPDADEKPTLAITLSRMSRGKMIGVKYNKDLNWVGSTVSFFEK